MCSFGIAFLESSDGIDGWNVPTLSDLAVYDPPHNDDVEFNGIIVQFFQRDTIAGLNDNQFLADYEPINHRCSEASFAYSVKLGEELLEPLYPEIIAMQLR